MAMNVTHQYQETKEMFLKIIKKLKPTEKLKLLSPPLSEVDKKKCFFFATKANEQIEYTATYICDKLEEYF